MSLEGCYQIPKVESDAFTLGAIVYFNTSTKLATTTTAGNTRLGIAIRAAPNPSAAVKVRIDGVAVPAALPSFTAPGDNGKVLTLVTGAPAWAVIP